MYKIGLDISSIGFLVLINCDTKEIVDICKVPQKIGASEYEKQITKLKPLLKEKGMKTKTQKQIVELNNKILNCPRDVDRVINWLFECKAKYGNLIVNIEKPLVQTFGGSQISSFLKMAEYMGIMTTILDYVGFEYNIIPIETWRNNYNYNKMDKDKVSELIKSTKKTKTAITREFAKQESIRIAEELIPNIKEWYILKGCRTINVDIVESALLSMV